MDNNEMRQLEAAARAAAPKITLQWENGSFVSYEIPCSTKPAAFAMMDDLIRSAEYPASIAVVLKEDGKDFWYQHGEYINNGVAPEKLGSLLDVLV